MKTIEKFPQPLGLGVFNFIFVYLQASSYFAHPVGRFMTSSGRFATSVQKEDRIGVTECEKRGEWRVKLVCMVVWHDGD